VAISDVVEAVAQMIMPQAKSKGLKLDDEACRNGAIALGDRSKVEQIVLNLVSNAVKFTASGGKITMACEARRNRIILTVLDTGSGIPKDKLDAIFEPFVQVGRTLTSSREGAGLGLAISRDLARGMGGDITVDSRVGVGSEFKLTLPAEQQSKPARA
jgi:signal transduction histidine kinase